MPSEPKPDPDVVKMFKNTITNMQAAVDNEDPKLQWAVLHNLHEIICGYLNAAEEAAFPEEGTLTSECQHGE